MKRLVEVADDGLESLFGKRVTLYGANYIYCGKLVGVNDTCVKLEDPKLVYETGEHDAPEWADAQALPSPWFVQLTAVESFGAWKENANDEQ